MEVTLARDAEGAVEAVSDQLVLATDVIVERFASRRAGESG
jgi:hypothetical protein